MIEPNLIKKLKEYDRDQARNKNPVGEDYINKDDLLSNDVFCIVFTTLNICNPDFAQSFDFRTPLNKKLIDFKREIFFKMMSIFFYMISYDKDLINIFKILLGFSKYESGNFNFRFFNV